MESLYQCMYVRLSLATGGVERAQNWRWKLITSKECILYLQISVDLSGISGDNLSSRIFWRNYNETKISYLAENARFVAPSKCCKPSPFHSWYRLSFTYIHWYRLSHTYIHVLLTYTVWRVYTIFIRVPWNIQMCCTDVTKLLCHIHVTLLLCVAVWCSVLQCMHVTHRCDKVAMSHTCDTVAVCCSALLRVAVAVCCSVFT